MATVYMIGGMDTLIKDFGWTIFDMDKESFYLITKLNMMDIGKMDKKSTKNPIWKI